ncbi:hypothetical protein [Catenulispora sp. GAS73]|uniref:hypothetical protein n=1 Tax=Catenulispora sp. GAS73 TaxID=3156269 RepID=UPI0035130BD8
MTTLLARARLAIEAGDSVGARAAWDEAERLGRLAGVSVRDRLDSIACHEDGLSWSLWGAANGNPSAMFSAACCYRDGVGTRRDRMQAVRWYLVMVAHGDGDAAHDAMEVAKQGMTDAQILEAGRLAGQEAWARSLISAVPAGRRRGRWLRGR